MVDFDGTIGSFAWPALPASPYGEVVKALVTLKERGFTIWIFTTRAWPGWKKIHGVKFYREQLADLRAFLGRWGIPYDGITHEKLPCMFMIDDRALNPTMHSWGRILEIVCEAAEHDKYGKTKGVGDA